MKSDVAIETSNESFASDRMQTCHDFWPFKKLHRVTCNRPFRHAPKENQCTGSTYFGSVLLSLRQA